MFEKKAKSLEDVIMEYLVQAGLSEGDEATQQLAGNLTVLFESQLTGIEFSAHIQELELAIKQRNRIRLDSGEVVNDLANRNMIDPNLLQARVDSLKRQRAAR